MPQTPHDLAALLGSRICHDLISPLGAIGNGVELLMLDRQAQRPELALIAESIANANARIRYFRVAYGAAGGEQTIGRAEVVSILADLTRGTRLGVDWHVQSDLPRREVRLAFLGLQCLEAAAPWGGQVVIGREDTGWNLCLEARRLRVEPAIWAQVTMAAPASAATGDADPGATGEVAQIGPAQIQFGLLAAALRREGRRARLDEEATALRLRF